MNNLIQRNETPVKHCKRQKGNITGHNSGKTRHEQRQNGQSRTQVKQHNARRDIASSQLSDCQRITQTKQKLTQKMPFQPVKEAISERERACFASRNALFCFHTAHQRA